MSAERRDLSVGPLGVGETLDRAVALHRRHFRALFLATLALEAPLLLLARLQLARAGDLALLAAPGNLSSPHLSSPRALWGALLPLLAVLLAALLVQLLLTAAAAHIVAASAGGEPAELPGPARRAGAAVAAATASLLAVLALPALGALPGALLAWRGAEPVTRWLGVAAALLGAGLALLWAVLAFLLAPAAAAVEGAGGLRALRQSLRLMRPEPGARFRDRPGLRASVVLLAATAITVAANTVAGLPRGVVLGLWGNPLAGGRLPLAAEVALGAFELASVAAIRPFGLVAIAVLYFERRARREGLDLARWARGLAPAGEAR